MQGAATNPHYTPGLQHSECEMLIMLLLLLLRLQLFLSMLLEIMMVCLILLLWIPYTLFLS